MIPDDILEVRIINAAQATLFNSLITDIFVNPELRDEKLFLLCQRLTDYLSKHPELLIPQNSDR